MKVEYNGELVSIYRLSQLSGVAMTSLYRAYHSGLRTGEEIVNHARKRLVKYKGEWVTVQQLCRITNLNYGSVKRRLDAGMPVEEVVADSLDRRGAIKAAKLSPSDVLDIYFLLFFRERTQSELAREYGVDSSTISDIWRHKHWSWLTAPLRYQLELENNQQENNR